MTPKKIREVTNLYRAQLEFLHIPKKRMAINRSFDSLSSLERLSHAHFLLDGIDALSRDRSKRRKVGSHLTAVQMILSFEGWYTLEDIMNHNRPF